VPRAGFESAIRPTLLVGVVNPVFSYTLGFPSRVLSQAELSREQIPTSAFLGTRQRQFSLDNLSLLLVQRYRSQYGADSLEFFPKSIKLS